MKNRLIVFFSFLLFGCLLTKLQTFFAHRKIAAIADIGRNDSPRPAGFQLAIAYAEILFLLQKRLAVMHKVWIHGYSIEDNAHKPPILGCAFESIGNLRAWVEQFVLARKNAATLVQVYDFRLFKTISRHFKEVCGNPFGFLPISGGVLSSLIKQEYPT